MSQNLTRKTWAKGWTPSADATNGDPNGLLRMDNLKLDKLGALTLQKGFYNANTSQFSGYVHSIYSRMINNSKHRFVGLSDGDVKYATDGINFSNTLITGGNTARARFTSIFGSVFGASGNKKAKFDGTNTWNWGVETPQAPVGVVINNQPSFPVEGTDGSGNYTTWRMIEGQNFINSGTVAECDSTDDTLRSIMGVAYSPTADFTAWPGGGFSTDNDTFSMYIKVGDTANLVKIRIEFILGDVSDITVLGQSDYYWKEFLHDIDNTEFIEGINPWTQLTATRSEFTRQGTDNTLGWNTVGGFRITYIFTAATLANVVTEMKWTGSSLGPLNGTVEYAQINVRNNNVYLAKSGSGPLAEKQLPAVNASAEITFANSSDPQITERWLYRRSSTLPTFLRIGVLAYDSNTATYTYTDSSGSTQGLSGSGTITDTCPDLAAQEVGIGLNLNIKSIADIADEFFSIIDGAYFERAIIATQGEILVSERLNPDAIDNANRLRLSGDRTESILWITKLSQELMLCATTKNLYELGGDFADLPDGTLNVAIRALGEAHPPLGLEFALDSGNVFYVASDGIRQTSGGASQLVSPQLNNLFRGDTCHGMPGINVQSNALVVYPIAIYKGQLVASLPLLDGERWLFLWDFLISYWRPWQTNPICLFVEEDGTLLAGYGSPGDYYIRVLDSGTTINNIGAPTEGQRVNFLTVFDDNGQPRNRKDAYTLRIEANTGGKNVEVHIGIDNGGYVSLGFINSTVPTVFNKDIFIPVTQTYGLGIRFSVWLTSNDDVQEFSLTLLDIEYDPRPEMLTSLRIQPSNLGTLSRKRFTNYAFVIDTLGNTCSFTPAIDSVILTADTENLNYSEKRTYILYFKEEQIGTDIGGIIRATGTENTTYPGVFEFYEINLSEIVSEKLPVPVKYLVIPANDYGNPNRKRHSSYKFQIDTRGHDVQFTPILDGVSKTPNIANTTGKRTHEYFFTADTIGIDIGGILETLDDTPFEYYGVIVPQQIEVLPPRLKEFRIPESNLGVPAKKRVRTLPMEINTNGSDVTFTPIVDNVAYPSTVLNTPTRQTTFHYFTTDVFGTDYSGELIGSNPFEFYGLLKPEEVEVLPVSKKFDQLGPIHLERVGKIIGFRIRVITSEVDLPWIMYGEDTSIASGTLVTVPNTDQVYEEEWITKSRNTTITRIEFGPTSLPFNRYYISLKVNYGGGPENSMIKLIKVQ